MLPEGPGGMGLHSGTAPLCFLRQLGILRFVDQRLDKTLVKPRRPGTTFISFLILEPCSVTRRDIRKSHKLIAAPGNSKPWAHRGHFYGCLPWMGPEDSEEMLRVTRELVGQLCFASVICSGPRAVPGWEQGWVGSAPPQTQAWLCPLQHNVFGPAELWKLNRRGPETHPLALLTQLGLSRDTLWLVFFSL